MCLLDDNRAIAATENGIIYLWQTGIYTSDFYAEAKEIKQIFKKETIFSIT